MIDKLEDVRKRQDLAREKLALGVLPPYESDPVAAGEGPVQDCALCELEIEEREMRYTVLDGEPGEKPAMQFHVPCYLAWERVSLMEGQAE